METSLVFSLYYTVKKVIDFPVPSRDVTYQTGAGKIANLFYSALDINFPLQMGGDAGCLLPERGRLHAVHQLWARGAWGNTS